MKILGLTEVKIKPEQEKLENNKNRKLWEKEKSGKTLSNEEFFKIHPRSLLSEKPPIEKVPEPQESEEILDGERFLRLYRRDMREIKSTQRIQSLSLVVFMGAGIFYILHFVMHLF